MIETQDIDAVWASVSEGRVPPSGRGRDRRQTRAHPDYGPDVGGRSLAEMSLEERCVRYVNPDSPYPIPRQPYTMLPAGFPKASPDDSAVWPGFATQFAQNLRPLRDLSWDGQTRLDADICLRTRWRDRQADRGYGEMGNKRIAYFVFKGVPDRFIYTTCGNDDCIAPAHLVTEKVQRKVAHDLPDEQVIEMRDRYHRQRWSTPRLAREYGIPRATVYQIVMGTLYSKVDMPKRLRKPASPRGKPKPHDRMGHPNLMRRRWTRDQVVEARCRYHEQHWTLRRVRESLGSNAMAPVTLMLRGKTYADIPMPTSIHVRRSGARRLTDDQVIQARRLYHEEGASASAIRRRLDLKVNIDALSAALRGEAYRHVEMPSTTRPAGVKGDRRLDAYQVRSVRKAALAGEKFQSIAGSYHVTTNVVSDIVYGRTYIDVLDEQGRRYVPRPPLRRPSLDAEGRARVEARLREDPKPNDADIAAEMGVGIYTIARIRKAMDM